MGTKRHHTHVVDSEAIRQFKSFLPSQDWNVVGHDSDLLGIDFRVDLYEDRFPSQMFFVQLKGKGQQTRKGKEAALTRKGGYISQPMDVSHLDYFMAVSTPVFLIVVDIEGQTAYWLFLQEYVSEKLNHTNWRRPLNEYKRGARKYEPTISVRVPTSNRLTDMEGFRRAVNQADGYMASLNLRRGIEFEERSLQKLDPRFDVNLRIIGGAKYFDLIAREPVTLSIQVAKDRHEDFVARGKPITISPGETKAEGSTLWESVIQMVAASGGHLEFKRESIGFLSIVRLDGVGNEVGRLENLACKYEGGPAELRFRAELPGGLLTISGTLDTESKSCKYEFASNLTGWYCRKLLELPALSVLARLLCNASETDTYRLDLCCLGGRFAYSKGNPPLFETLAELVTLLWKAQEIAKRFGINPSTQEYFSRTEMEDIAIAYELMLGNDVPGSSFESITCAVISKDAQSFLEEIREKNIAGKGPFTGTSDFSISLMGEHIVIKGVRHIYTNLELLDSLDDLQRKIDTQSGTVEINLATTPDTICTVRGPEGGFQPEKSEESVIVHRPAVGVRAEPYSSDERPAEGGSIC